MISILPAMASIMVLNFENNLTLKCPPHVSYDAYQHIFFFSHHHYHYHFVLRAGPDLSFLSVTKELYSL